MKDNNFRYFRSRAFRNYLFSFVGIFFIVLSLLCIVAMRYAAANMERESIRLAESKLHTIAEDMESQTKVMREMAAEVARLQVFSREYLEAGKYREIELLDRLVVYKQNINICEYYFLKFYDMKKIYTSARTTKPIGIHLTEVFGKEGWEKAGEAIDDAVFQTDRMNIFYKQGETGLLIYPLGTYAVSTIGRDGVLCFQISEEGLKNRVERIVGKMDGELAIYYGEKCLLGGAFEKGQDTLVQVSQGGNYTIYFNMDEDSYFSWNNVLSPEIGVAFIGAFLLLGVLGVLGACWNFKPLRKLAEKYRSTAEGDLTADWDSIDALIDSLWRGKETNSKLVQIQYRMLREQTIQLIASGGYSDKVHEHMELLNIKLEAAVFGIIKCIFDDRQKLGEYSDSMYRDVEDLSDDGIKLYAYWDSSGDLCVLAAAEEEYQLEEAAELLQSLFEAKALPARVAVATVSRDLKQINQKAAGGRSVDVEKGSGRQNATARAAVEYIRANCKDYNLSLDMIAQEFQITSTYICRIVKQQTGMSYKEYLTGLRMEEAKRLLADPEISVIDVCQQTGYNNVSHFIKVFQKYTGVTPAKYRDEQ